MSRRWVHEEAERLPPSHFPMLAVSTDTCELFTGDKQRVYRYSSVVWAEKCRMEGIGGGCAALCRRREATNTGVGPTRTAAGPSLPPPSLAPPADGDMRAEASTQKQQFIGTRER